MRAVFRGNQWQTKALTLGLECSCVLQDIE